jgi:Arabinofuranosyltransferase N terminal/Arabinofuranosyltransferase A C terminal
MSKPLAPAPVSSAHPSGPSTSPSRRRFAAWRHGLRIDAYVAVLTWAIGVPIAFLIVHAFNRDPFKVAGSVLPMAVGGVIAAALLALLLVKRTELVVGVAVGAYAAWIALTMAAALHGTPFGYGELSGDQGRLVASATKDMTGWLPVDAFVPHLATEYPPLYPWLIGHTADLVNQPAWRLFHDAQIVLFSGSLILGYLLWRRLVGPGVAFMIVALAPTVHTDASKGYEFVTLVVIVPWILAAFARLPEGRGAMHWLPAGIIGGLIVTTYSAYLVFGLLGIIAMVVMGLRVAATRRAYFLHLVGVVVTAFVVASWYVIPFAVTSLTKGGNRLSDLFLSPEVVTSPLGLPFLQSSPLSVLELVGLGGLVWYRRSTWWAQPLLLLVASAFVYHGVFLLNTVHNNHTGYLQYTERLTGMLLVAAGVLTVSQVWPAISARMSAPERHREMALLAVAVVVSWTAIQGWEALMPGPRGVINVAAGCSPTCPPAGAVNLATRAQIEPLPDGQLPRFAPPGVHKVRVFPTSRIQQVIESTLGPKARPVVLSFDQRLFDFLPYYGYMGPGRLSANTLVRWDDRIKIVKHLATETDPATFATSSRSTRFGGIDAFVLHRSRGIWTFAGIPFSPTSFGPNDFRVVKLPSAVAVAVRLPAGG